MAFKLEPGKTLIIKLEQVDPLGKLPYPIVVDENGRVTSGLASEDIGATLIGFGPRGENRIDVWPAAAVENPESVVGLVATFGKGNFFEWAIPVRELVIR